MGFTVVAGPKAFTGTDGTNISADSDFAEQNGVTGQMRIRSNGFANAYGTMADVCWQGAGSFTADQFVDFDLAGLTNQGDIVGGSLLNNGAAYGSISEYRTYYDSNNATPACVVSKMVSSGTPTIVGSVSGGLNAGNKVRCAVIDVAGSKVFQFYRDTGSGFVAYGSAITDSSSPLTSGKPGLCGADVAVSMQGDNWQAGNVTPDGVTMTASQGSYALTGQATALAYSGATRVITATKGDYTLTGQATGLIYTPNGPARLTAAQGSYSLTGEAARLSRDRTLVATSGSYTIAGSDAAVDLVMVASRGNYTLTGEDVSLIKSTSAALVAVQGNYTLTGEAMAFVRTKSLAASRGLYSYNGQLATLRYSGAPAPALTWRTTWGDVWRQPMN